MSQDRIKYRLPNTPCTDLTESQSETGIKLFNFGEFSTFLKCMSFPVISAMNISVIAMNISVISTQTNRIYVSKELFPWLWLSLLFTY